jgi:hypothetical protein
MSARLTSSYITTSVTAAVCCVQPYRSQGAGTGVLESLLHGRTLQALLCMKPPLLVHMYDACA